MMKQTHREVQKAKLGKAIEYEGLPESSNSDISKSVNDDIPNDFVDTEEDTKTSDEKIAKDLLTSSPYSSKDHVNPEIGITHSFKKSFLIINTDGGYAVLNVTNISDEYSIEGIKNILSSFFPFEKLTAQKLSSIASDERTSDNSFAFSRNLGPNYTLVLPDGSLVPLQSLKRGKGKKEKEESFLYRKFRLILFRYLRVKGRAYKIEDGTHQINHEQYSKFAKRVLEEQDVLKVLKEELGLNQSEYDQIIKAYKSSERVRQSIEDIKQACKVYFEITGSKTT